MGRRHGGLIARKKMQLDVGVGRFESRQTVLLVPTLNDNILYIIIVYAVSCIWRAISGGQSCERPSLPPAQPTLQ